MSVLQRESVQTNIPINKEDNFKRFFSSQNYKIISYDPSILIVQSDELLKTEASSKSEQESVMDRLRNRRGLRSRSRKSHVGTNMLDAAGFTEDEKLEAFRIYDETLKADREREERRLHSALEGLVDDHLASEAEEALRSAPLTIPSEMEEAASTSDSTDVEAAVALSAEVDEKSEKIRRIILRGVEAGESEEEIRKRILETFLKDADKASESREEERQRQIDATRRKLEEQRRRRRDNLVRERVAKEIKHATVGENYPEEEEEAGELISSMKEAADAIAVSRAEAAEDGVEKRGKWDLGAPTKPLNFAEENEVGTNNMMISSSHQ